MTTHSGLQHLFRPLGLVIACMIAGAAVSVVLGHEHSLKLPALAEAGWHSEAYHKPTVSEQDGEIQISAAEAPAGLGFVRQIDPAQRYRLKVRGAGGPFLLRIRRDAGDPSWFPAPDSVASEFVIERTARLELMFYSDTPASYRLSALSLEPCGPCMARDDLVQEVRADLPVLTAAGWDNALYQKPDVLQQDGQVRIDVAQAPAGLYLLKEIDPAQRYRLRIRGAGSAFMLRIRRDGGEPSWFPASVSGASEFLIDGTARLELLFYSHNTSTYGLAELSLDPCPTCAAESLMQHVRADLPALTGAGWENELYREPAVFERDGQLHVVTTAAPAGLFLVRQIDPARRYRLRVRGAGGPFVLRIRRDGGGPSWFAAPVSGTSEFVIEQTARLELLFYSQDPSSYRLIALSIAPCPACAASSDVVERLRVDLPMLTDAGWDNEVYQKPDVVQQDGQVHIVTATAPAGLTLVKEIDPAQRYRLRIRGADGPFLLRISKDDRSASHVAAPVSGTSEFVIEQTARLELLFYSNEPSSYRLTALSLEPCAACMTAEALVRRIQAEVPELDGAEGLEKARLLLKWSANVADWSIDNTAVLGAVEAMSPADALYNVFDKNAAGVLCGGQSVFYANILHLFGIEAFTVNFGIDAVYLNHVSVVVPHMGRHYLLDPSFAGYFARNGEILPLEELIATNRQADFSDIRFVELGIEDREFLGEDFPADFCAAPPRQAGPALMCKPRNKNFFETYLRGLANELASAGLAPDARVLPRLLDRGVFHVGPAIEPAAREAFIETLTGFAIPMRECTTGC